MTDTGTALSAPLLPAQQIDKILAIFNASRGVIRPHFILTGPSGSGKSHTIKALVEQQKLAYMEINAAQLTKEGTAGNSLSKALTPLIAHQGSNTPMVCFVDEFDKLFISGNNNSDLAHETTNGVQNEFLSVLESDLASVFHEYGKYLRVPVDNVLFVFAGAFNGQENVTIDDLRDMGVKTEFLGRVGLIYNLEKLPLKTLIDILHDSELLKKYLKLFPSVDRQQVLGVVENVIERHYESNTLGARIINNLLHQYFINGEITEAAEKQIVFTRTLELPSQSAA